MVGFTAVSGEAPTMIGILWMLTFIAFVLVGLRLYTRLVVIHNYGWDDHFFNLSVVRNFVLDPSALHSPESCALFWNFQCPFFTRRSAHMNLQDSD